MSRKRNASPRPREVPLKRAGDEPRWGHRAGSSFNPEGRSAGPALSSSSVQAQPQARGPDTTARARPVASPMETPEVVEVEEETAMERRPVVPLEVMATTPPVIDVPVQSPTLTLATSSATMGHIVKRVSVTVPSSKTFN